MAAERRIGERLSSGAGAIRFALRFYWEEYRPTLIFCLMSIALKVALPYLNMLLPKLVIDNLTMGAQAGEFIRVVGGVALLLVVVNMLKSFTDVYAEHAVGTFGVFTFLKRLMRKKMDMDYELMEDPECKKLMDKTNKAIQSNHSLPMNIPRALVRLISNIIGFLLYASIIASVHPAMLPVLFVCSAVNWWALSRARKYEERTREERSKTDRKLHALFEAMRDRAASKDIRLYSANDWLRSVSGGLFAQREREETAVHSKTMLSQLVDALMILVRDGAAYALLIWLLLEGRLTLGEFVFAFSAVGALAGWISGILRDTSDLAISCVGMEDVRASFEYPDRMNRGAGVPLPEGAELPPSLELRGVTYAYPEAEAPTLKDVNLTIRPGERIAIVGANGAGKTTLVKLLCGLYLPTEGEVLLNGKSSLSYNREEYYSIFSAVFQDIHLLACDIAGNVSQRPAAETDEALVKESLALAGLEEKIKTLPMGDKTLLVRSVNPEATEFSGGESQKLAMARALYKGAPVILLDEPTAALDPIAENEVYMRYAELTEGKTSVYISHRLASTRFCDRILLINESTITEEGTHDELMRRGGVYANMFTIQASYYQSEGAGEEASAFV